MGLCLDALGVGELWLCTVLPSQPVGLCQEALNALLVVRWGRKMKLYRNPLVGRFLNSRTPLHAAAGPGASSRPHQGVKA